VSRWHVATYNGARDNRPKPAEWDAETLVRTLCTLNIWTGEKVQAPAWSPIQLHDGQQTRAKAAVRAVTMLVLDCDAGDSLDTLEALGDEFCRVAHTSWSHHADRPKARLVFPFAAPCPAEHWPRVWAAAAAWAAAGGVTVDPAAKDCSRLYFGSYVPDDITAREHWEAWAYGPEEEERAGRLPVRPRKLMSWAWLLAKWEPEEEEVSFRPPPLAGVGTAKPRPEGYDEKLSARRRAFADACIESRIVALNGMGKGSGRNRALYSAGRLVRGLERSGDLDAIEAALHSLATAALGEDMTIKEARRAIMNGYRRGYGEGDQPFPMEEKVND